MGATTNLGLPYPELTDTPNVPRDARLLAEALDTFLPTLVPPGTIVMYGSATPPVGWALCDGQAHGSAHLQAAIGSATTPDLRDRFIVAAGGKYASNDTGGAESVTLTAGQSGSPSHGHTARSGGHSNDHAHHVPGFYAGTHSANRDHSHYVPSMHRWSFTGGGHEHSIQLTDGSGSGDGVYVDTNPTKGTHKNVSGNTAGGGGHEHAVDIGNYGTHGQSVTHEHGIDIPAHNTVGVNADHTHGIEVDASAAIGASDAHENRPPYYALTFVIKL